jgi:SAM-dependent methyltransferase
MAIEQYITKKVGKPWDDPVILERLRRSVVAQKNDYWRTQKKRSLSYAKGYSVLGYLAYHFPVYFMQSEHLLYTLTAAGLLKPEMNVLDIGTGPGVVPLAIADFYSRLDHAHAVVTSVERSEEHIEAFTFLTQEFTKISPHVTIDPPIRADIRMIPADAAIPDNIDLCVFSNVLNELSDLSIDQRADTVMQAVQLLSPDGSIVIVEPAEKENTIQLRQLARVLADRGLTIHSPCTFLFGTRCDPSRCWSFETQEDIGPTRLMERLAACDEPFRYINTDIKYAYVILRKDQTVQHPYRVPPHAKYSRFSKLHLHVSRRINVIAVKMSQELGNKKTHVFKLCDGTTAKPVYAVLPSYHITPENKGIVSAQYGAVLELHNVLVRYNKAHDAYNLLISRNTRVTPGPENRQRLGK